MTQLYSNLVKYVNNTTYLYLVLAVLCSLVVTGVGMPHCTLDNINGSISSHHLMSHVQLSKCPLFILIIENKGGPTHGFKTKNLFCSVEV